MTIICDLFCSVLYFCLSESIKLSQRKPHMCLNQEKQKTINKVEEKREVMGRVPCGYEKNPSSSHPLRALFCKCWNVRSKLISLLKAEVLEKNWAHCKSDWAVFPAKSPEPEIIMYKILRLTKEIVLEFLVFYFKQLIFSPLFLDNTILRRHFMG